MVGPLPQTKGVIDYETFLPAYILCGFAFLSICAFWQLYDSIIPLMLKTAFT